MEKRYQATEVRHPDWTHASPLLHYGPFRKTHAEAAADIPAGVNGYVLSAVNWRECIAAEQAQGDYPWPIVDVEKVTCPHCLGRVYLEPEGEHWFCGACLKPVYVFAADHGVLCPTAPPAR